jgi:hypothetical protein
MNIRKVVCLGLIKAIVVSQSLAAEPNLERYAKDIVPIISITGKPHQSMSSRDGYANFEYLEAEYSRELGYSLRPSQKIDYNSGHEFSSEAGASLAANDDLIFKSDHISVFRNVSEKLVKRLKERFEISDYDLNPLSARGSYARKQRKWETLENHVQYPYEIQAHPARLPERHEAMMAADFLKPTESGERAQKSLGFNQDALARPANYRTQVVELDLIARQAMRYLGEVAVPFYEQMDEDLGFGYSSNWTAKIGEESGGDIACETSGGINLAITRTDYKKIKVSLNFDNCVEFGWRYSGTVDFNYDDAKVSNIEAPRNDFPLIYETSNFSITDPLNRSFSYQGQLKCDVAANAATRSLYFTVDRATGAPLDVQWKYDSALDNAIDIDFNYGVNQRADGSTLSNLIYAFNCDADNVAVVHRGKTHRIRGQKLIYDQWSSEILVSENRVSRLQKIGTGKISAGPRGSVSRGFDHSDFAIVQLKETLSAYESELVALSLQEDEESYYVVAYTVQTTGYYPQYVAEDGLPSSSQIPKVAVGIDFDRDGEKDLKPFAYNSAL